MKSFEKGDWVYYLGVKGGGYDTGKDHWIEGVVGQIVSIEGNYLEVNNIQNASKMKTGSNYLKAFRFALPEEMPGYQVCNYQIY